MREAPAGERSVPIGQSGMGEQLLNALVGKAKRANEISEALDSGEPRPRSPACSRSAARHAWDRFTKGWCRSGHFSHANEIERAFPRFRDSVVSAVFVTASICTINCITKHWSRTAKASGTA